MYYCIVSILSVAGETKLQQPYQPTGYRLRVTSLTWTVVLITTIWTILNSVTHIAADDLIMNTLFAPEHFEMGTEDMW